MGNKEMLVNINFYFLKMFSIVTKTYFMFLMFVIFYFSSANGFNLDRSKISSSGKGLKDKTYFIYGRKHCGKKDKMLATSIFSFFHNVFKRLLLWLVKTRDCDKAAERY